MTNVLIIGANGRIARLVRHGLLAKTNEVHVTAYLRHASRITDSDVETVIEGDVFDQESLHNAMAGQDIVYANLSGRMADMATLIINEMVSNHVKRLIWVTGSGLYHEAPNPFGAWVERVVGHQSKEDTRAAARQIEASKLNATIIRAAVLTDTDEVDYELTEKGEVFKGTLISRKSIADLITRIILTPQLYSNSSLGIDKPSSTFADVERLY